MTRREYVRIMNRTYIKEDTQCWVWTGAKISTGYGETYFRGVQRNTHRIIYEQIKGRLINRLTVDHICFNKLCINPEHLQLITYRENLLRSINTRTSINANKTHCNNGHEFTYENTYIARNARNCRACRKLADERRRLKNASRNIAKRSIT